MSLKVSKSIGLLYELNSFPPEIILKTIYTSLIHPYLSYGIEAWHGTYQNNTSFKVNVSFSMFKSKVLNSCQENVRKY